MVWNALIIASLHSALLMMKTENMVQGFGLSFGLFYVSRVMYNCLVHYTGAIPAEYFSLQKRPKYKEYIARTNMFFPGPQKG